ncbi:hypothetical protein Dsin_028857 [Dipteronia sinensis]|uniref:Uncharacterized protein n=1 Tax=Dipteronia sinensis TaxID=43782 RepID=A0AAE0DUY2_9ROSI|nr:hypothetical protein Dsin_028857 [Dipteronia sinensis]
MKLEDGLNYVAARTKKQARIKAARNAILAIKKVEPESYSKPIGNSQFSVIPYKNRAIESANKPKETVSVPKVKKARFMKKMLKRKIFENKTKILKLKVLGTQ